jgi:predicted RNA-binding Zn ribbon-like protein
LDTYSERLVKLAEDLINTYDTFLDEPEHLRQLPDLQNFLRIHDIPGEVDEAVLAAVRDLRERLRAAWTGEDMESMAAILNSMLAVMRVTSQIIVSDADSCDMVYAVDPAAPLISRLIFESAMGISIAVQTYGLSRMRACDADPCRDVFIDISRNRSRRFCSDRCANRYNVQAFRNRQHG